MSQKKTFDSAVKDHHLDLVVGFECRDDLVQLRNGVWTEDIERRVVKCYPPVRRRAARKTHLCGACWNVVRVFHVFASLHFSYVSAQPKSPPVLSSGCFVRWPYVRKLGDQIAMWPYLVFRHLPICEDAQERIEGIVRECPAIIGK